MTPRTTLNATVSSGSCGFYGVLAASTTRSYFDYLSYVVASEPQGCVVNEYGLCASMTSYNLAPDFRRVNNGSTTSTTNLFQFPVANCHALNSYDGFCYFSTCLYIGKCDFEPLVTTAPPIACGEEELCTLSSKIISGVLIGLVVLSGLCSLLLPLLVGRRRKALNEGDGSICYRFWIVQNGQQQQQQSISLHQLEQLRDRLLLHGQPTNEARQVVSHGEGHTTASGVKYYVLPEPPAQVPQQYYYDDVERDEQYPYKAD